MKSFFSKHTTKTIGAVTTAVAAVAVADPALMAQTLGPKGIAWAMLLSGIATAVRGIQNTPKPPSL